MHDIIQNDHHFTEMNPKILAHRPQNLIHKLQTIQSLHTHCLWNIFIIFLNCVISSANTNYNTLKKKNVKKNPETPIGAK